MSDELESSSPRKNLGLLLELLLAVVIDVDVGSLLFSFDKLGSSLLAVFIWLESIDVDDVFGCCVDVMKEVLVAELELTW